ncbi:EF-P 5-aminopentanol modification-associated protein YfmH [Salicibibacter kimchii]|uniref:Insulinase family protein n=1 Tax=Salicibibacter kimchii TaxID=2099786 RepID=A0A345BVU6_9BACI|nr:pitrilysin family protein [Salicibibacter kimchii]AXF55077.1 insulinase family protein [Salicibibacter kimchii]
MEKQHYEQIDETIYMERLSNGLNVYVLPKADHNKTFSIFTTDYGSIDQTFTPINSDQMLQVPDGIAHFLEHKLFEEEDGSDAFDMFSKRGAQTNAFTSFTRTAYLFSGTSEVEANVETLLDFVQSPYFTEETVENEKGIIGQEINMYNDDADWRLFFGLISALYKNNPVRIDIAGTVQSIDDITKDMLYTCYQTFYHPSNMVLFVVGPVDPEETIQLVKANQEQKSFPEADTLARTYGAEPQESFEREKKIEMNVQTPKCLLGYKEPNEQYPLPGLAYELGVQLLLDVMFGLGSSTYEKLYKEGVIDNSFSADFTMERSFGFSAIGGDTKDPDRLVSLLNETVDAYQQQGLGEEEVRLAKKRKIGTFLKQLNSPEFIATQFTRYEMNGDTLFEVVPTLEKMTIGDLENILNRHFRPERSSVVKVEGDGS